MDIKKLILDILKKKGEVRSADIVKATGYSREYVNRSFQQLRAGGEVILVGKANKARYVLGGTAAARRAKKGLTSAHRILRNKDLSEDRVMDEIRRDTAILDGVAKNVSEILYYAFTEMLNNAIEHSVSKKIDVAMARQKGRIGFSVTDKGVGIFNNIRQKKHLADDMEAIQDLTKGKLSTAPKKHTGEGIFFTSKIGDVLTIQSSRKKLIFDNILNDTLVKDVKNTKGTRVFFSIGLGSKKDMSGVFRQYTDESFEFSKTRVRVRLFKAGAAYISRSQARRIMSGLDKFKMIALDFKNIDTIGQGFADEVFRIWKARHPASVTIPENANENVELMIKRAAAHL